MDPLNHRFAPPPAEPKQGHAMTVAASSLAATGGVLMFLLGHVFTAGERISSLEARQDSTAAEIRRIERDMGARLGRIEAKIDALVDQRAK